MLTNKTLTAIVTNLVALTAAGVVVWTQDGSSYSKDTFHANFAGRSYKLSGSGFLYINGVAVGYDTNTIKSLQTQVLETVIGLPALGELDKAVYDATMILLEEMAMALLLDELLGAVTGSGYSSGLDYAAKSATRR